MLCAFGFERYGVVISDLYFVDPDPLHGQESPERGVRLELRLLEPGDLKGSIYSARPIQVGQPVWRADLLESADGPHGTLDRAHHHPAFSEWEPGRRVFDPDLTADPVGWVGRQLGDLETLAGRAGLPADEVLAADAKSLRDSLPEIVAAVRRLLDRVNAGELAVAPGGEPLTSARVSWL
ncbi:MAG TPA: hypothetical protein VH637_00015 [Streptosporangiaceae bacterium]